MRIIGPTFADELKAAGIALDGIAWTDDGDITYRADVPVETKIAVTNVFKVHDATKTSPAQQRAKQLAEYPALWDLLDALLASQPTVAKITPELQADLTKIQTAKAKYPLTTITVSQ